MSEINEYSGMFIQTLGTLKGCGVSIYGHVHNSYALGFIKQCMFFASKGTHVVYVNLNLQNIKYV